MFEIYTHSKFKEIVLDENIKDINTDELLNTGGLIIPSIDVLNIWKYKINRQRNHYLTLAPLGYLLISVILELIYPIIINSPKRLENNNSILYFVFESEMDTKHKIKLLINHMGFITHEELSSYLILLGDDYSKLITKGGSVYIDRNNINIELVEYLKKYRFISSFRYEEDSIKVNRRRK